MESFSTSPIALAIDRRRFTDAEIVALIRSLP
jgi:hypothetical protein